MSAQVRLPVRSVMPATGTLTQTTTPTSGATREGQLSPPMGTLRLRGAPEAERRSIRWAEDVVDNEGMGKKKSKVCCIYHKPRAVGESSDESSDSSSGDSDSEPDNSTARKVCSTRRRGFSHGHDHNHKKGRGPEHENKFAGADVAKGKSRRQSPNAYEKMPRTDMGKDQSA